MSSWKSYVLHDDYVRDATVLVIGRQRLDVTELVTAISTTGATTEAVESNATHDDEHVLRIPTDMARALHEALSRHFGGVGDAKTLRKDYEAERVRVDRLIDAMTNPLRQVT